MKMEQVLNEQKYSKRLAINFIWNKVKDDLDLIKQFETVAEAKAVLVALLEVRSEVHVQNFITRISSLLGYDNSKAPIKGTSIMEKYSQTGLYELIKYPSGNVMIKPSIKLDYDSYHIINQYGVLPPMVVKPVDWYLDDNNQWHGGYLSIKHNPILGKHNMHHNTIAVDALNKLQSIAWKLDTFTLFNFSDKAVYDSKQDIEIAIEMLDKPFYFMWQFDKRGRMYSKGYNINLQSTEYRKALLDFASEEYLNEGGVGALLCHIANVAGYDKLTWNEREAKGKELVAPYVGLEDIEIDLEGIDKPIMFTKAVRAYLDHLEGKPVSIPTFWDSTSSGVQIMGAVTGCRDTATKTNLINTGKREDLYTYIADLMNNQLDESNKVDRATVKKPTMTHWYSSKATPKRLFNPEQLEAFYSALSTGLQGAEEFMEAVSSVWSDKDTYIITAPDGHTAYIPIYTKDVVEVELDEDTKFTYEYNVHRPSGSSLHLVANVTHLLDAYVAREVVRRCDFEVGTIHDDFACHPNNAWELQIVYREILADLADSNVLSNILTQLAGYPVEFEKLSNDLSSDILASQYALS